jgi:hypothetical protein
VLDSVSIEPSLGVLSIHEPRQKVKLTVSAYDQSGKGMLLPALPVYTVSPAGIAAVSADGSVTAISTGTAVVTGTISHSGVTRSGSMVVLVEEPALEFLSVAPSAAGFRAGPGQTVQLVSYAVDVAGSVIARAPTYWSEAPSVATVSSTGLVTALESGVAIIRALLTAGDSTRTDSTVVRIFAPLNGVYDLTGVITSGEYVGHQYTATLDFHDDPHRIPGIGGMFSNLRLTGPNASGTPLESGLIASTWCDGHAISTGCTGLLEIDLYSMEHGFTLSLLVSGGSLDPEMTGTFYIEQQVSGSFTARRRTVQ